MVSGTPGLHANSYCSGEIFDYVSAQVFVEHLQRSGRPDIALPAAAAAVGDAAKGAAAISDAEKQFACQVGPCANASWTCGSSTVTFCFDQGHTWPC